MPGRHGRWRVAKRPPDGRRSAQHLGDRDELLKRRHHPRGLVLGEDERCGGRQDDRLLALGPDLVPAGISRSPVLASVRANATVIRRVRRGAA
ncbi:hypothetical protein BLA24_08320 [Streptomyces cinnamoneus]|uniref:Uncharacterized protein n=1 Tax=Streptomyces cinnamoneus TaxID=53446 RepID=A0A2G1XM58_STRCJ|nr:hypothetical protein [Streptomyces cinnamoneus]PHQ52303.1 hypothetical protein BLA24_08320 [Streptomyces cinnamoneus]